MAQFSGVGTTFGFSEGETPFLMVPVSGTNLLLLHQGDGYNVRPTDSRLKLREVQRKDVSSVLRPYVFTYFSGSEGMDVLKNLWSTCQSSMMFGSRLFSVTGIGRGLHSGGWKAWYPRGGLRSCSAQILHHRSSLYAA